MIATAHIIISLSDELSDLEKQLSEGGSSVHELEKAKKKLEGEKEELATALEVSWSNYKEPLFTKSSSWQHPQEAETQLENEEARVLRAQLELTQLKQEIERRLDEKDDEMESLRKNQQRQLEAMQHSLDAEVKAKNDQQKQKKLIEGQIDDMQGSIDELEKVSKLKG